MTRIAALLIVFALTGGPITNVVCFTRCHAHLMTENCDEFMAEPTVTSGNVPCEVAAGEAPFVREEGVVPFDASVSVAAHSPALRLLPTSPSYTPNACLFDGRPTQPVVLRL